MSPQLTELLDDYPNTLARATSFDDKLTSDALNITPQDNDYAGILALSVRQMFGNIELTSGWNGTAYDPTDIMVFLSGMWLVVEPDPQLTNPPTDGVR